MTLLTRLLLLLLLALAPAAFGAAKTEVKVLLSHLSAPAGQTITGALQIKSEEGWHTYWRNPGDAGLPTTVEWELPPGVSFGAFEWPVPKKKVLTKLHAYVYEGEILLLFPVVIAPHAQPQTVALKGAASWLECSDKTCVPQDAPVESSLAITPAGTEPVLSPHFERIQKAREHLPQPQPPFTVSAEWEPSPKPDTRSLLITWEPGQPVGASDKPDFFPFEAEKFAVQAPTEIISTDAGKVRLRKSVQKTDGDWPETIRGLVLNTTAASHPAAYAAELKLAPMLAALTNNAAFSTNAAPVVLAPEKGPSSLALILGLAFLGGLILNIMPCVLPVIALKILGFVNQSREEPGRIRQLGLMYMFGVLASFLVLALAIISARSAGGDVNWGMQMQNPYFVIGMTVVVTLVALNLWGVFEITVSGGALGAASQLAAREGRGGAFYNGVLATLLATPCTAPALAFAVGSVLTQSAFVIIITFLAIGLGLAAPYVLLCWNPRWLKLLPKPGAWMEKFKMAMGFPMAATALWLMSVGAKHFGKSGALWLSLFLLFLALAAWIFGEFVQRGSRRRPFALGLAAFVLIGGYAYALESKLNWRHPPQDDSSGRIALESGGLPWQKWSAEAVAQARASGHPVLVDFTADWCLTCQVNKETSLEIDSVKAKITATGTVPFLADFTRRNSLIAQEIKRFNRAGVPLVIVYPAEPNAAPIVLPEILTPSIVLNALEMAAKKTTVTQAVPRTTAAKP